MKLSDIYKRDWGSIDVKKLPRLERIKVMRQKHDAATNEIEVVSAKIQHVASLIYKKGLLFNWATHPEKMRANEANRRQLPEYLRMRINGERVDGYFCIELTPEGKKIFQWFHRMDQRKDFLRNVERTTKKSVRALVRHARKEKHKAMNP